MEIAPKSSVQGQKAATPNKKILKIVKKTSLPPKQLLTPAHNIQQAGMSIYQPFSPTRSTQTMRQVIKKKRSGIQSPLSPIDKASSPASPIKLRSQDTTASQKKGRQTGEKKQLVLKSNVSMNRVAQVDSLEEYKRQKRKSEARIERSIKRTYSGNRSRKSSINSTANGASVSGINLDLYLVNQKSETKPTQIDDDPYLIKKAVKHSKTVKQPKSDVKAKEGHIKISDVKSLSLIQRKSSQDLKLRQKVVPVAKIQMTGERTRNKSLTHANSENEPTADKAHSEQSGVYCRTEPAFDYTSMDLKQLRQVLTKDLLAKGLTKDKAEKFVDQALSKAQIHPTIMKGLIESLNWVDSRLSETNSQAPSTARSKRVMHESDEDD